MFSLFWINYIVSIYLMLFLRLETMFESYTCSFVLFWCLCEDNSWHGVLGRWLIVYCCALVQLPTLSIFTVVSESLFHSTMVWRNVWIVKWSMEDDWIWTGVMIWFLICWLVFCLLSLLQSYSTRSCSSLSLK